jgi:transcriptional regulator with XRE-family HTH domain
VSASHQPESAPFGVLLRQHRRRLGLSQEALGERASFSPGYISMLERGVRMPTAQAAALLTAALQLSERERRTFADAARPAAATARGDGTRSSHSGLESAPALGPLFGRQRELDVLTGWILIEQCRVVALTGMGGSARRPWRPTW